MQGNTAEKPVSTAVKRSRGRPAQLSRERILETTLSLLQRVPLAELTMQRLARELNITPTALYGYFHNQEELFASVSERVLAGVDLSAVREATGWRDILRNWTQAIRNQMLLYPHSAEIVQLQPQVKTPASWFELMVLPVQALRQAGLSDYALMDSLRCICRVVFGAVVNELTMDPYNLRLEQADASAALDHLSPECRTEIEYLLPYLGDQDNDALFSFTVERLLDGIELMAQQLQKKKSKK
jgi:TetR/AcrR family transcriptional regulator, tetracycline repressor protein